MTYQQNSERAEGVGPSSCGLVGDRIFWWQAIDLIESFDDASNLGDRGRSAKNPTFGAAAASFPTKLSTEAVGDSKSHTDHELTACSS
ncbi:MAG: hypothetical protein ABW032_05825 [Burkholderiaceae bacterium]